MRFGPIAAIAVTGSLALVTLESFRNVPKPTLHPTDGRTYETTGSVETIGPPGLSLSDEQRERIHSRLIGFPDAVRRDAQEPVLSRPALQR
jgi:hypothetical protein